MLGILLRLFIFSYFLMISDIGHGKVNYVISGNKKTKTKYIASLADRCVDDKEFISPEDSPKITQCLSNTRHFSHVEVKVLDQIVYIHVEDKWSLIPVPAITKSKSGTGIGLFIIDTNSFGLGIVTVLGLSKAKDSGKSVFFIYDPSLFNSRFSGNLFYMSKDVLYTYERNDKVLEGYRSDATQGGFGIGYQVAPYIKPSLNLYGQKKKYKTVETFTDPLDYTSI